jgi:hypothetical protein
MSPLTRRAFAKTLLAASVLPITKVPLAIGQTKQDSLPPPVIPDAIAGYTPTNEEKQLAAKFLANHEKNMMPLREKDLPNSLPPNLLFKSPTIRKSEAAK